MRNLFYKTMLACCVAGVLAAQTAPYRAPRTKFDTHPDLSGIYEAMNTANWDLQDHSPQQGTMWQTGAINS